MGKRPKTAEGEARSQDDYGDFIKEVGERVRAARMKAGWTQYDLADKAGKNQSYIYEIETGSANPTLRTFALFADVLGMDARDLMPEGTRYPPSNIALDRLEELLQRLGALLAERETQEARRDEREAKRRAEDVALIVELRELPAVRAALEHQKVERTASASTSRSGKSPRTG